MKTSFILFVLFCSISCTNLKNLNRKVNSNNLSVEQIYPYAIRGDMRKVFDVLDTLHTKKLNERELEIKNKYYDRFVNKTEEYNYNTRDSIIIKFVDMFHSYWNDVMINDEPISIADSVFLESMSKFLFGSKYESENIPRSLIKNDIYTYGNSFLNERGYFSNAFGKTGHLYDLFLWKKENVENYTVELIDETTNVTVHLMDDFISVGWSHYTTFGRSYASGWANRAALFCVKSAYDIQSENYKISYLTHEGQHFSDYKKYPRLMQKDLEYRAKLVELAKSDTTTIQIVKKFITNSSSQSGNAHAFANYCVIRDLSKLLFSKEYVTEKSAWLSIDTELIREKSKVLFYNNTQKLDSIGSDIVTEFIR